MQEKVTKECKVSLKNNKKLLEIQNKKRNKDEDCFPSVLQQAQKAEERISGLDEGRAINRESPI